MASALGVTEHTVCAQIKQIYAKTGVDSRARLVKLVYALASPGIASESVGGKVSPEHHA